MLEGDHEGELLHLSVSDCVMPSRRESMLELGEAASAEPPLPACVTAAVHAGAGAGCEQMVEPCNHIHR